VKLEDIRKQIEEETQFAPAAERHRNALNNAINRFLGSFVISQPWVFRQRTYKFTAFPDITWDYGDWTISQIGTPVRLIRISDSVSPVWNTVVTKRRIGNFLAACLNNPVQPPETLRSGAATGLDESGWGTDEFLVERADAAFTGVGKIFDEFAGIDLWLDPRFSLMANPKLAAWTGNWTLRFLHYALPRDCAQVERVVVTHQNNVVSRVALDGWDPAREAIGHDLDPADTGVPAVWAAEVVGSGANPGAAMTLAGSLGYPHQINSGGARMTNPDAPTTLSAVLASAGGGTWNAATVGKRLQYCATWAWGGMESGPSPVAEATLVAVTDKITLTLERYEGEYGRIRYIYRRVGEGPWRRISAITTTSLTALVDIGADTAEPAYSQPMVPYTQDQRLHESTQQWVRLYPRPTVITDLEVRYLAGYHRMTADEDVPEIPDHLHALVVHHVVANLGTKHGAAAPFVKYHRDEEDRIMQIAVRRYLVTDNGPRVRQSTWAGASPGYLRWDGTITYTGDS
jgi:hypothetical protein